MIEIYSLLAGAAVLGTATLAYFLWATKRITVDNQKAEKIAKLIARGAMTFMWEECKIIFFMMLLVQGLLFYAMGTIPALLFMIGALCSMITGYIGMYAATIANVRTAMAAQNKGEYAAFLTAFFGGGTMGFAVGTFGFVGLGIIMYLWSGYSEIENYLMTFTLGASLVAFFARIGGGIYTKSADVGADLVGKLEAGIPEDDPRNPAVIADNVGDCVGDTAGMGADIYESYVSAVMSAIVLGFAFYKDNIAYSTLPLVMAACGMLGSLLGVLSALIVRVEPATMLRNASYVSIFGFLGCMYWYINATALPMHLFVAMIIGCAAGVLVGAITEYYTGSTPIKNIAENCKTGAATNVIYGLSVGLESVVMPVILIGLSVLLAYRYGGGDLYGIAIAAVGMLSTVAIIMTLDGYGPIADNAGGIAEMAQLGKPVRAITDKLDALGNTTAAIGKGFAIGSALMTAIAIFAAYAEKAGIEHLDILDPMVMVGVLIGGTLPFWVASMTMRSVGTSALAMVEEVRRQFATISGLMEGKAEPNYERCIAISTKASLREMILPGVVTIVMTLLIKFIFGTLMLGGMIIGVTVTGSLMALFLANVGGAWDNAKKYIEAGNMGGKGSDAHKAAIVGDTVGDPCKDTSGPALGILIKLVSVLSLLLVSM